MAVISITDTSKMEFYRGGKAGASVVVGYEDVYRRVARYEFTVPSPGASSITAQVNAAYFVEESGKWQDIRFYIGTSPTSHVNAGPGSEYTGTVSVSTNPKRITLSADIVLVPGQTYYLWFFPSTDYFGWYYWALNCTITTYGGSASQPTTSASAVEMGSPVTIYTNRAAGFTHKLTYQFGKASGTIATGVTDSCSWTPSTELAAQIPNAASGTATISCTTYDESGKQVGDPLSVSITLTVPQSLAPTAGLTSVADSTSAKDLVGYFVQNVSRLVVDAYGTAKQGATIATVSMKLNGKQFAGGLVTAAGDLTLEITATDSRGLSGKTTSTVHVEAYAAPRVSISVSRCTEDGTADDTGEYANVTIKGTTTAFGGANAATLTFQHKSQDTAAVSTGSFTYTQRIQAPSTEVLVLTATLNDKLTTAGLLQPGQSTMPLSVGYATMDFLKGGKGIAIGTTATEEGFVCAMHARFTGGVSGAAPAGYGLGTNLTDTQPFTTIAEIDGFRVNGARRIMLSTEHIEGTQYGTLVCSAGDRYAEQRLFSRYALYGGFYELKRVWQNGVGWQPWEWVNPAMRASGKEYRTTERFGGKPVYVKVIDMGAMPNASIKEVAHGIQNIGFVVDVRVFARDDASNLLYAPSTAGADTTLTAAVGVSKTTVWVNTNTNRSAMSGYALLKYTKTTD